MTNQTNKDAALIRDLHTYLERWGDKEYFDYHRFGDERVGQAFFNALMPGDQETIRATCFDPFHNDVLLRPCLRLLTTIREVMAKQAFEAGLTYGENIREATTG